MNAPDLILHNGLVTTLDRSNPSATAVAIRDGTFLRAGTEVAQARLRHRFDQGRINWCSLHERTINPVELGAHLRRT